MLEIESNANDDAVFLALARRLIAGAATAHGFNNLIVVHIDGWFGDRWLGFCGKLLGTAGVRSRRLSGELTPPPFHPHRVQSTRAYRLTHSGRFEHFLDWPLHGFRPSQANLNRTLMKRHLYAWYSGDTTKSDRGVVMVYLVQESWNAAWYVAFDKTPHWHLARTVSIAPRRVRDIMEHAPPGGGGGGPAMSSEAM